MSTKSRCRGKDAGSDIIIRFASGKREPAHQRQNLTHFLRCINVVLMGLRGFSWNLPFS
jgi:hypothetical protein